MRGLCECGCGKPTNLATDNARPQGRIKGQPHRFLRGHGRKVGQLDRLMAKVEKSETCWNFRGRLDKTGYGRHGYTSAHRMAYTLLVGPIPEGLELDHLCNNRVCVNPDHLEPVTHAENVRRAKARQTHCKHGHEFTAENTYINPDGARVCRACVRARKARSQERVA